MLRHMQQSFLSTSENTRDLNSVKHTFRIARLVLLPARRKAGSENTLSTHVSQAMHDHIERQSVGFISQLCTSPSGLSASFNWQIREVTPANIVNGAESAAHRVGTGTSHSALGGWLTPCFCYVARTSWLPERFSP